jgi:hypothetical protein
MVPVMAKIIFVHGMRMQHHGREALHETWYRSLLGCLRRTEWGRANPDQLPNRADVRLAYWADLFRRREVPGMAPRLAAVPKGAALDALRASYYALLRGMVRLADKATRHDKQGRPRGPVALLVDQIVYQTAVYMQNGPVFHPDPSAEDGAFFQMQARFESVLDRDTRVVIAHSLGSVVAYEGLCRNPHNVDTLITIGSPIATPHLILEPMKERLGRLLNHPTELPPPWPGVRQWLNFYAPADVWCVPVKSLAPIFGEPVRDIEVVHGNPHDFERTHKLTTYLKHEEIGHEIARVLETSTASRPPRPVIQSSARA